MTYEYICGRFPAYHAVDPEQGWTGSILTRQQLVFAEIDEALLNARNSTSHAIQYVAELYSECMDIDSWEKRGVTPLIEFVEETVGAWPMIRKPKQAPAKRTWQDIFASYYAKTGLSHIFDIRSILQKLRVQNGPLVITSRNKYDTEQAFNETVVEHYRQYLDNLAAVLGAEKNDQLKQAVSQIIHFEQKLAKAFGDQIRNETDFDGSLAQFTIATHNRVNWLALLNQILKNFNSTIAPYTSETRLDSRYLIYINLAIDILNTTPIEVVQNFFGIAIASNFGVATTNKLRQVIYEHNPDPQLLNATKACPMLPLNWPLLMGRIYVDTHFSLKEKKVASTLVDEIKASFRKNLQNNKWLDAQTRKYALGKLDAIQAEVGFPDWILSNEKLDNFYPDLKQQTVVKGQFFRNLVNFRSNMKKIELEDAPSNHSSHFTITPAAVNAFYNILENSIFIPAGILQSPFFDHELPLSMSYGAIGTIIGHELTHGFDSRGRNYDLHGKFKNWWTVETAVKFEEKARCIRQQYSRIFDPRINETLNGALEESENIADHGGIKESFLAYQSHKQKINDTKILPNLKFNSNQLFFVSYANLWCQSITVKKLKHNNLIDPHAPSKYRVNVVLSNTPQFAEAFNCPVGSKMNPTHRCSVW